MNKKTYLLVAIIWLCQFSVAQTYMVNSSFNSKNEGTFNGTNLNGVIIGAIQETNNKYLIYGRFDGYRINGNKKLARINPDGSPDLTFRAGTIATHEHVNHAAIQQDGKYIIGGSFYTYQNVSSKGIARLNSDGSLDNTLNVGTGFNYPVSNVFVLNSGKILVGGDFTNYNGQAVSGLVRLNTDGSLDTSFTTIVTQVNFRTIRDVVELIDGKLIVVGTFTSFNGQAVGRIVKLNPDGSTDTSFNNALSGANDIINDIELLSNGKIYIAGRFSAFNGSIARKVARLNTDGTFDTTFGLDSSINPDNEILKVTPLSTGKVAIGGRFDNMGSLSIDAFAVLNDDGTLFNYLLNTKLGDIRFMIEDAAKNILLLGDFDKYDNYFAIDILQIDENFQVNENFNIGGKGVGSYYIVSQILPVQNDKYILSGTFKSFDNWDSNKIVRINSDGNYDNTFNIGVFDHLHTISFRKIYEKANGNLYLAGSFFSYDGDTSNGNFIEIDNTGTVTPVFNSNLIVNGSVYDFDILPSNKIVIGGGFSNVNNVAINRIAIINSDGTLDTSFNPGVGATNVIYKVKFFNNKIYVAGPFSQWNNNYLNGFMVRLNLDGTLDTSFNAKFGFDVNDFVIQPDGKIVAVGKFKTYDGTDVGNIARILTNGDLDTSFNSTGNGGDFEIQTIVLQDDNKFMVGGTFTMFNNQNISGLVRLNADGNIDNTFTLTNSVNNGTVYSIVPITNSVTNTKDYIVGGNYRSIGGINKNSPAKIDGNASLSNNDFSFANEKKFTLYPNPTNDVINIKTENLDINVEIYDLTGKLILKTKDTQINVASFSNGLYFVKLSDNNQTETHKFIKY